MGIVKRTFRLGPPHVMGTRALLIVSAAVFLLLFIASLQTIRELSLPGGRLVAVLLIAGSLYLLSHLLRALRLAVVAAPMLGLSYRTTIALHLTIAPWSLVMPFKLDELLRLNELRKASGSLLRSAIVLLIDRSMDGVVLVILSIIALSYGHSQSIVMLIVLALGLFTLALALFAAPPLLGAVQSYIFANHYRERAFVTLRAVANARDILVTSRGAIAGVGLFLAFVTVLIWLLEFAAISAAAWIIGSARAGPIEQISLMLLRAAAGWRLLLLHQSVDVLQVSTTLAFFWALLSGWVPMALLYQRRVPYEPLRPRLAGDQVSKGGLR